MVYVYFDVYFWKVVVEKVKFFDFVVVCKVIVGVSLNSFFGKVIVDKSGSLMQGVYIG